MASWWDSVTAALTGKKAVAAPKAPDAAPLDASVPPPPAPGKAPPPPKVIQDNGQTLYLMPLDGDLDMLMSDLPESSNDFYLGPAASDEPVVFPGNDPHSKSILDALHRQEEAYANAKRRPGENVREYLARLREMQASAPQGSKGYGERSAVQKGVDRLETDLRSAMNDGRIRPVGRPEWATMGIEELATKQDIASRQLEEMGVLRRDDEAVYAPDGKGGEVLLEDGEGAYNRDVLEALADKHLGEEFRGPVGLNSDTQDYLDYLRANSVDQRTIDDIASGALKMDQASREARATAMGLDPGWTLERRDVPLKTDFRGFTAAALSQPELKRYRNRVQGNIDLTPRKEGLVYTTPRPNPAQVGVMIDRESTVTYPLWAPNRGIAGVDEMSPQTKSSFEAARKVAPKDKSGQSPPSKLPYPVGGKGDTPEETRSNALAIVAPEKDRQPLWAIDPENKRNIPYYGEAETRKSYTEPLMGAGKPGERVLGTLVNDETGLSVAFTPAGARQLRRADLAALDPRFRTYRNLLQGLAPPVAAGSGALAAGAAGSSPRTESR